MAPLRLLRLAATALGLAVFAARVWFSGLYDLPILVHLLLILVLPDRLPDDTVVYPGHGRDTTLGAERPSLEEWRARGW